MYLPLKSSVFTFTLQYVNSNLGHQNKKKTKRNYDGRDLCLLLLCVSYSHAKIVPCQNMRLK